MSRINTFETIWEFFFDFLLFPCSCAAQRSKIKTNEWWQSATETRKPAGVHYWREEQVMNTWKWDTRCSHSDEEQRIHQLPGLTNRIQIKLRRWWGAGGERRRMSGGNEGAGKELTGRTLGTGLGWRRRKRRSPLETRGRVPFVITAQPPGHNNSS